MKIGVLIVDDRPEVRRGLCMRMALEPDLQVVGEAADGLEAIRQVRLVQPDVVLMDVGMPILDGIAATREIAGESLVIILSMADTCHLEQQALEAGAVRFICKAHADGIVDAIRTVSQVILDY